MKEQSKKWLLSLLKTSGSKRRQIEKGNFSEERNTKKYEASENLPIRESFSNTLKFKGYKLNYSLLIRFLNANVNKDWDNVYSEFIDRIPKKLSEYRNIIFYYVADKIEIVENQLYNTKTNKFIWMSENDDLYSSKFELVYFYVCPKTNLLLKGENWKTKKTLGSMEFNELKKFRKNQKKEYFLNKKKKQDAQKAEQENAKKALLANNKK